MSTCLQCYMWVLSGTMSHSMQGDQSAFPGLKVTCILQAMTASEVSSEASEQDTYCTSELEFPDKESCNYEAAVYQGWQGSLFSTSNPTAASQVMPNSIQIKEVSVL